MSRSEDSTGKTKPDLAIFVRIPTNPRLIRDLEDPKRTRRWTAKALEALELVVSQELPGEQLHSLIDICKVLIQENLALDKQNQDPQQIVALKQKLTEYTKPLFKAAVDASYSGAPLEETADNLDSLSLDELIDTLWKLPSWKKYEEQAEPLFLADTFVSFARILSNYLGDFNKASDWFTKAMEVLRPETTYEAFFARAYLYKQLIILQERMETPAEQAATQLKEAAMCTARAEELFEQSPYACLIKTLACAEDVFGQTRHFYGESMLGFAPYRD